MAISSNCVMHFTGDKDSLKGVLKDNFRVKYCKETIILGQNKPIVIQVPMVSFCEIPLAQIKEHIGKYGSYGIGLTREWAIKNKLNPVLYIEQESCIASNLHGAIRHFIDIEDTDEQYGENLDKLFDIFRYMKNYQGDLVRKDKTHKNYRFSDEREWRFVPDICKEHEMFLGEKEDKEKENLVISEVRLKFDPKDIKYIFIKDDSEISEFIRHLDDSKGANFPKREVEILTTRIITTEQIYADI